MDNNISSQYHTGDTLVAEAFAKEEAGGVAWIAKLYQDGWEVANLTFASFDEADKMAAEWGWSH